MEATTEPAEAQHPLSTNSTDEWASGALFIGYKHDMAGSELLN